MGAAHRLLRKLQHALTRIAADRVAARDAVDEPAPLDRELAADRFTRLCQWCVTGRLAAAELELFDWHHEPAFPGEARVLLASLLSRRGQRNDSRAVLTRMPAAELEADAAALQSLACVFTQLDQPDSAARVTRRLHDQHANLPSIETWLSAIESAPFAGTTETAAIPPVSPAQADQLAAELVAHPEVIPSLVAAQKIEPVANEIALLRLAINRATRDLQSESHRMLAVCHAMAELAVLAGDTADARRWAHRGLRINPYAATLAIILGNIADDAAVGRPAAEVLREAAAANPSYPDLRAAHIRRERRDGHPEIARLHLDAWLRAQPTNSLARQLEQELAA